MRHVEWGGLAIVAMLGCSRAFVAPEFAERQPRSIAVLPMEDKCFLERESPDYGPAISEELGSLGYDVQDLGETKERLEKADLLAGVTYDLLPRKYCQALEVDALFKSRLGQPQLGADTICSRGRWLDINFALVDCGTGALLWKNRRRVEAGGWTMVYADQWSAWEGTVKSCVGALPEREDEND